MARSARTDTHDSSPRNLGRYRLYGELAAGGMATVHFGRQLGSGGFSKMVAIKRLHPQFGKIEEFVDMFLAEARLAARIRHPSVVQPLDVLRVEDEVFLVMEYVEGDSLSRLMKATIARQEKVPLPVAVAILSGVLRGLHAAHEAKNDKGEPLGIVHRDVSPQNVLVGIDGTPRVIDFGIAKAADSVQVTREGELKGKLAYMAPEILSGQRGTRRVDIYAAAVVLWEVLTAQRLFDADYQSAVLANILHRPVDPPSDFIPGLPPALDRVVMKGLARDPSDRYATAREMAAALEEAAPAASAAVVGEWVELVAGLSLANRGKRVAQIEALSSEEDAGPEPEDVLSEFMSVEPIERKLSARPPPPSSIRGPMAAPAPPPATLKGGMGAPAPPPPAPLPPVPLPPPRAVSRAGYATLPSQQAPVLPPLPLPLPPRLLAPPSIVVDETVASAPAWPVPGIAPAAMGTTVVLGPKKRSSGGGIVVLILALALAAAILYVGLPEFLKRSYTAGAAQDGVTLTLDGVEVSLRHVRLLGVTATMADLPGVTVHAHAVEIAFSGRLDPTDVAAHDVLLSIDGSSSAVTDAIRRAKAAHDWKSLRQGTLRQVTVEAGHLVWSRAFGEGTRLEAENITLDIERNAHEPLGDDLTFASPIVDVTASWGKMGPWVVNGQLDHGQMKATLNLDPTGTSRASVSAVVDDGSVTTLDMSVPRSSAAQLGLGGALVGRRAGDPLFITGEAHYAVRSASRVEAMVKLELSGARLAGAVGTADGQLEAHIDGDPARPIDVTKGVFGFGPFRGTLSGPVSVGPGFLRAELGYRTGAARCPGGGEVALGGGIVFDTRNLGDGKLIVSPSTRCGMKVLPL
jgi:serine/threonine protein kinase